MFSNQVNFVLFGSSAQGLMTIQVGPFSALKQATCQFKWNCSLICIHLFLHMNACLTWPCPSVQAFSGAEWTSQPGSRWSPGAWHSGHWQSPLVPPHYQVSRLTPHGWPLFPGQFFEGSVGSQYEILLVMSVRSGCLLLWCEFYRDSNPTSAPGAASLSYLHLFDVGVPLPHLLHVSHQLFIKCVRMLLQHHFQLEHLPNVRQHLTQDFVPICLRKGSNQELKVLSYLPLQLSR